MAGGYPVGRISSRNRNSLRTAQAVLADGRKHHAGHPVLELAGLGFVRAHDQLVQARLADEAQGRAAGTKQTTHHLVSGSRLPRDRPLLVGAQAPGCLMGVDVAGRRRDGQGQRPADVRSAEAGVAVERDGADGVGRGKSS